MPGKRRPDAMTFVRGRRPFTCTVAMHRAELEAFELLAAVHGYQSLAPFLRRLLLDACDAHGIESGTDDEYPLPGQLRRTREAALRIATARGTYTPPPGWWMELHDRELDERRAARRASRRAAAARAMRGEALRDAFEPAEPSR